MSFSNARIYDLDGDFEAKFFDAGWSTSELKEKTKITERRRKLSAKGESPDYEKNSQKNVTKARGNVRRRIKKYKLIRKWELTFADNIQEVKEADYYFRNFMKRINRRFPGFKYVATREFQDKNGRGAVHYHIAVNMFIPKKELDEIWGQGFTWVRAYIKDEKAGRKNIYNYLTKYLTKYSNDERLKGYHLYLCSQGLNVLFTDMHNLKARKPFYNTFFRITKTQGKNSLNIMRILA
ncbi:hypothetical protein L7E55_12470 [Pelotomaculum isophthalicicum JI]|uniref:Replication-associated protein ORF2/G2P domain-containing protein n=1 Tax=Pelotomaculum isophthalicicum JI TaxID=947010 RepID=A0A9X4JUF9_9FIRM|nr:hypothetical protein [Pelotomaculum isophthalicicum]MDF9409160.1 hypothetical protein [Pelotomaculum isophthalicicum JI]